MSKKSLKDLQTRYIAGEHLSSEEENCLLRGLDENPDTRQEMLIDEAIDNQLRCLARINDEDSVEKFVRESVERAVASQQSTNFPIVIQTRERNSSRSYQLVSVFASVCAMALLLIGIAVAWYATQGRQKNDFGFAHLANSKDLSWELIDGTSRRLNVFSGYGEVHFENGTIAQFAAPVVIELRTPSTLFVESGSVKMNVPSAAVGFTVETPIARIVDLGTKFDVDVGDAGQTETRLRSGVVTFETQLVGNAQGAPIMLTAEGLNRVSARESSLTGKVRSVVTTASGPQGQFYGKIHADGQTVEFGNRQEYDDFLNRLNSVLEKNPSQFREQWQVIKETTTNGASTKVESSSRSGMLHPSSGGNAHEMLIEQLRAMREQHQGNPQMQQLLEGMILQVDEGHEKLPQ